jgi:hypothetical protein
VSRRKAAAPNNNYLLFNACFMINREERNPSMTRSYGGAGDEPPNQPGGRLPNWQPKGTFVEPPQTPQIKPVRIDVGRRFVALVIDLMVAYFVGIIVSFLPFLNTFLPLQVAMVLFLLGRDFLFEGRGVGKNLMGIQVVDIHSGVPCSLLQSIQRNVIILAPYIVLEGVGMVLKFVPIGWLNQAVVNLINMVGMVYVAVVLPLESYRAYSRDDGLRIGDEIAGTCLIESPMSFARVLPRQ